MFKTASRKIFGIAALGSGALIASSLPAFADSIERPSSIKKGSAIYSWGKFKANDQPRTLLPACSPSLSSRQLVDVAVGPTFSAAIDKNGTLLVWKGGDAVPCIISTGKGLVSLQASKSKDIFVALSKKGVAFVVDATSGVVSEPTELSVSGHKFVSASVGARHIALLSKKGVLFTQGSNELGQLGLGDQTARSAPTPVPSASFGGQKIERVACGNDHTVVVTEEQKVFAFGSDKYMTLGVGRVVDPMKDDTFDPMKAVETPFSATPIQILSPLTQGTKITHLACGAEHSIAVTQTGDMLAWGSATFGNLGDGTARQVAVPRVVPLVSSQGQDAKRVKALSCGNNHCAAVVEDVLDASKRSVLAWGANNHGQVGNGKKIQQRRPVEVISGLPIRTVSCGVDTTVALE